MATGIAALARDGGLAFGGDYNPEQWHRATWVEDVALMREAGVSWVSVGVFAWSALEPEPGRYTWGWLDEVLDLLDGAGIGVALATPVASPPPWLAAEHPDTLPVDRDGRTLHQGSRSHFCPSAPAYRRAAVSIAGRVAARYAGHPAIRLWHAGNEYGQVCYCDHSAAAFRTWLRRRYGDLDRLNEAWATQVWSQHVRDWAEVFVPRAMPYHGNPARELDFRRFCSEELLSLYRDQRAAVRRHDMRHPVTTNLMGFFAGVDPDPWRADLDVVADDAYPDPADPHAAADAALVNHLNRGLAAGPWMRMEQAASAVSWREHNLTKSPERVRAEVVQAVAQGCDAVGFFQWRQARSGPERFHSAMLPVAGADSDAFRGIVRLGADLEALRPLAGSALTARVAILWDWPSWWAGTTDALPTSRLDPLVTLRGWHRALWRRGVTVDLLTRVDDLDQYAVVLAPALSVLAPERAGRLTAYVEGGGTLAWGPFGGVCDELGHLWQGRAPVLLRDLLGVSSEEWVPLPDGGCAITGAGLTGRASVLGERTRSDGAEVVATYADGPLAGAVAVARHRAGAGRTLYIGATLDEETLTTLLAACVAEAGVPTPSLPDGVELTTRGGAAVVVNHSGASVHLDLDSLAPECTTGACGGPVVDLLGGPAPVGGSLELAPYGAAALVHVHRDPPTIAGAR